MKILGSVLFSIALAATGRPLAQTGCGSASGPTASTAGVGSGIVITNLRQNEVVGYELLLLKGTLAASADRIYLDHGVFPGETAYVAPVETEADGMPKAVREWPAGAGRFKAMVHLKRGPNRIFLSAPGHPPACIDVNYSPSPVPNRVRMVFVLAQDALEGPGVIPAAPGEFSDVAMAKRKLAFGGLLLETAMAELLHDAGLPRRTVNFKRDLRGRVDVTVFRSAYPDLFLRSKTAGELWELFHEELDTALQDGRTKFLTMLGDFGAGALGGGNQAMFGTSTLYSWAQGLDELVDRFSDERKPGEFQLEDESAFRNTFWANYSTGIGATLHELGHALGLPHSGEDNDIMERGFDRFNRIFMMHEDGAIITDSAVHYAKSSADLLYANPWVQPPAPAGLVAADRAKSPRLARAGNRLTLDLPDAVEVSLEMFGPDGARAAKVHSGALARGRHEFALPRLAPGIYFCAVKTGTGTAARSRILIH